MPPQLKPLADQIVVITGASSGIGLATARAAARRGAKLVLAARSVHSLQALADELKNEAGTEALVVPTDVADKAQVEDLAEAAIQRFGGFDTWINNAGTGLYGRVEDVALADMRRLFDTNFWGVVHGSLVATGHLKSKGGALINVGSTLSDRAVPLQGAYAASKHAVKAFTDALRMELDAERARVSITLIKPGAIDTPFTLNARNYLRSQPKHVPPVYSPDTVARAIVYCAETPVRDVFVGGGGKGISAMGYYTPALADRMMARFVIPGTESDRTPRLREQNGLQRPSDALRERGDHPGHVMNSSLYTTTSLHPWATGATLAAAGLLLRSLWRTRARLPTFR
jgi:short-subunit dehydrogenase